MGAEPAGAVVSCEISMHKRMPSSIAWASEGGEGTKTPSKLTNSNHSYYEGETEDRMTDQGPRTENTITNPKEDRQDHLLEETDQDQQ